MNPHVDFHAIAPELVLTGTILVVLIADLIWPDRSRFASSRIASIGVLPSLLFHMTNGAVELVTRGVGAVAGGS